MEKTNPRNTVKSSNSDSKIKQGIYYSDNKFLLVISNDDSVAVMVSLLTSSNCLCLFIGLSSDTFIICVLMF